MSWLAGIAFVGIVALSAVAQSEYHKTCAPQKFRPCSQNDGNAEFSFFGFFPT
jgi:hypothetical protein